jgi:acyl-CoA reductase-like NAD-dependent aldehyde dehydrogenase
MARTAFKAPRSAKKPGFPVLKIFQKGRQRFFEKVSPATLEPLGTYAIQDEKEVEHVLDQAREAFETWSVLPLSERAQHLKRFRKQIVKDMHEIVDVICSECGKTEMDAIIEIFYRLRTHEVCGEKRSGHSARRTAQCWSFSKQESLRQLSAARRCRRNLSLELSPRAFCRTRCPGPSWRAMP